MRRLYLLKEVLWASGNLSPTYLIHYDPSVSVDLEAELAQATLCESGHQPLSFTAAALEGAQADTVQRVLDALAGEDLKLSPAAVLEVAQQMDEFTRPKELFRLIDVAVEQERRAARAKDRDPGQA